MDWYSCHTHTEPHTVVLVWKIYLFFFLVLTVNNLTFHSIKNPHPYIFLFCGYLVGQWTPSGHAQSKISSEPPCHAHICLHQLVMLKNPSPLQLGRGRNFLAVGTKTCGKKDPEGSDRWLHLNEVFLLQPNYSTAVSHITNHNIQWNPVDDKSLPKTEAWVGLG